MVTFAVDDVAPAPDPLPTIPLADAYAGALAIGGDPGLSILEPNGVHPLLAAVGQAFADHRPLVLTPDAVWLTIAAGLAQHIRLNAEELRPRLVVHTGKKRLEIRVDGSPTGADDWQYAIESWHKLLSGEIRDADRLACDFTTSTDVDRVAAQVVTMDAYSPYFAYWMVVACGIPSITLTGTVADWQKIRDRVDFVREFGLETWCDSLAPILDQFVRAANGDADTDFWRRVYNPRDAYGGAVITGWITRFYPYLAASGVVSRPNPMLDLPLGEPRDVPSDGRSYRGPGISSDAVPAVLSRVVVNLLNQATGETRAIGLHAGLVGVTQEPDGSLRPVSGWHAEVADTDIGDVLDRIVAEHQTRPPVDNGRLMGNLPAELVAVYDRIGSATLFGGAWSLRECEERGEVPLGLTLGQLTMVVDLPDGRTLGAYTRYGQPLVFWVAARIEPERFEGPFRLAYRSVLLDDPAGVRVYGTSLARILEVALDNRGDFEELATGNLADLMPRQARTGAEPAA